MTVLKKQSMRLVTLLDVRKSRLSQFRRGIVSLLSDGIKLYGDFIC